MAWRKRKAVHKAQLSVVPPETVENIKLSSQELVAFGEQDFDLSWLFNSAAGFSKIKTSKRARAASLCQPHVKEASKILSLFQRWAESRNVLATPVLVKINVFKALISNSLALGFVPEDDMDDNAVSRFCVSLSLPVKSVLTLPVSLRPTELQCQIVHHPWIGLLPVPRMRDNILTAMSMDMFDEMEFCGDVIGLFSRGNEITGLIVWRDLWDITGWEVTESFLKYWSWTIKGCWEIFESTYEWRAKRGLSSIYFDHS